MAQNIVRYKQRSHRTKFLKVTQGSKNLVYSVYIFQWCKQPCDRKCEWQNEQMGEQWFWIVSSAGITYHIFLYLISNACISFAKKRLNETIKISRSWNSCQAVIESFQAVNKETTSCLPAANHLFFSCQDGSNGVKTQHLEQLISSFSGIHHTLPEDGSPLKVDQMHLWCIMEVDGEWSVCGWVSLGDILLAVILHWTHITYRCTPASPCRYAVNISTQLFSS